MNAVIAKFEEMGARAKVLAVSQLRSARTERANLFRADIQYDAKGPFYLLTVTPGVDLNVIDLRPSERHLLLMATHSLGKDKFLCGHDEREWFVAAVPEIGGVRHVASAREALKPWLVRRLQARLGLTGAERQRRKTAAYVRQGEWFFVPDPRFVPLAGLVLQHEPIRRGSGKPHWCEYLYRTQGQRVYVSDKYPSGVVETVYQKLLARGVKQNWRMMVRNARVYVKGKISHPDHRTITLHQWHLVQLNTESEAAAAWNVVFLD